MNETYEDKGEAALVKIGGRRFVLSLLTLLIVSGLAAFKSVDGNILRDVVLGIVGIYVAGNTVQKVKTTKTNTVTTTEEPA